jgi:adenylosuccinate lyase
MHPRYPAPLAEDIFSDEQKVEAWRRITDAYAVSSIKELERNNSATQEDLIRRLYDRHTPTAEAVRTREAAMGHDVVAFISLYTEDMSGDLKRHIHRGLTSSDLVELSHHTAMFKHASMLALRVEKLIATLGRWEMQGTARIGRTHGQIASVTTLGHQMRVHQDVLHRLVWELRQHETLIKTPGPTGFSPWVMGRGRRVTQALKGRLVPSTQVIPRDYQIEWAAIYLRLAVVLENLALQVRLGSRSDVGDLREGATANRVGSSAMPHKKNPIDSEKVCGLARVARGYFMTIAEGGALWEERDLTNSSMERIAVPDLAAVVEHMLDTMTLVMSNLEFRPDRNDLTRAAVWSNLMQTYLQEVCSIGSIEASQVVRKAIPTEHHHVSFSKQVVYNWIVDNYSQAEANRWVRDVDAILDDALPKG